MPQSPLEQRLTEIIGRVARLERQIERLRATEQMELRAVRATHSTGQVYTPGLVAYINFDAEEFDYGSMHTAPNTNRLTVPEGGQGFWLVMATVRYSTPSAMAATDYFETYINVNNSFTIAQDTRPPNPAGGGATTGVTLQSFYQMDVGDYFQLGFINGTGGNTTVLQVGGLSPYFMALRIPI